MRLIVVIAVHDNFFLLGGSKAQLPFTDLLPLLFLLFDFVKLHIYYCCQHFPSIGYLIYPICIPPFSLCFLSVFSYNEAIRKPYFAPLS